MYHLCWATHWWWKIMYWMDIHCVKSNSSLDVGASVLCSMCTFSKYPNPTMLLTDVLHVTPEDFVKIFVSWRSCCLCMHSVLIDLALLPYVNQKHPHMLQVLKHYYYWLSQGFILSKGLASICAWIQISSILSRFWLYFSRWGIWICNWKWEQITSWIIHLYMMLSTAVGQTP